MPWDKFKTTNNGKSQWCIYKTTSKGAKTGSTLGCHDTQKDANAQLAALYANEKEGVLLAFNLTGDQRNAVQELVGADAVLPEGLHLTLFYINQGVVLADFVYDLRMVSEAVAESFEPITGSINGLVRFIGDTEDVIALTFDAHILSMMRSLTNMFLQWTGIPVKEQHSFVPHITIGTLAKETETPKFAFNPIELRFDTLSLCYGQEVFEYTLLKQRLARELPERPTLENDDGDAGKGGDPTLLPVAEEPEPETTAVNESEQAMGIRTVFRELERQGNRIKVQIITESIMSPASYPDIPLPADINRALMGADDFFVTLPIGQYNAESLNGHDYSANAMNQLAAQVNSRRPESNWGHVTDAEFGYKYAPPPMRWLVSTIENEIVYAKGRPQTQAAKEYYKNAEKDNARVGTSIMAWATVDGSTVTDLEIITIDLADPARVGVPMTAAKPKVTTDMNQETGNMTVPITTAPAPETAAVNEQLVAFSKAIREALGVAEGVDLAAEVKRIKDQIVALETENKALLTEAIDAEALRSVKLPATREEVKYLVLQSHPSTKAEITSAFAAVRELDFIKTRLAAELVEEAGPIQTRPANSTQTNGNGDKHPDILIPEEK